MKKYTLQPDVDLQDVLADESVINYASTDNSHEFMMAEEVLGRQKEGIWEDTELIEVEHPEQSEQMIMLLVKGREKFDTLLLKYFAHEDPDEANVLYRQPVLDIFDDDMERNSGLYIDLEIDNS